MIGQNLAVTLIYPRRPTKTRMIWADAIYIKQVDLVERSQQVLLMGEIYSLASGVIAFLGPEAGNSILAMQMLENAGTMVEGSFLSGKV